MERSTVGITEQGRGGVGRAVGASVGLNGMPHEDGQRTDAGPGTDRSPEDTAPLAPADASQDSSAAGSRGGAGFETMIGRYVVDQGLATREEVEHCVKVARASEGEHAAAPSLTRLLVEHGYVTAGQMQRVQQSLEPERGGKTPPGYKILGKLGAGAMATVFKARQVSLNRAVAIKILPKKFAGNPGFIDRFFAEGRAAAKLNHPNIVQAIDVGNIEDTYFFVMEYVDGGTVHDVIAEKKRYSEAEALKVALQVARALKHAHDRGLIHRDVKPKNLMISKDGTVKLADMGLARAISDKEAAEAEKGKAFGTPYYISPEQIMGKENIGPQADIYSLGATLYHMVTGQVPFEGKNPQTVMTRHLKTALVPPDHVNPKLSAGISEVIEMMMAKKPQERYRDCADLIADLEAVQRGDRPPLAHKELLDSAEFATLAQTEATLATEEIAVDRSRPPREVFREPAFLLLLVVLALSIAGNVLQIAL